DSYHRTWSHSAPFAVLLTLVWPRVRPHRLRGISAPLFLAVLMSHGLIDLLCTADAEAHGVMLFWPFADWKLGWPVLVPLYQFFAEDPFSPVGAAWFTFVELFLAAPLWLAARTGRNAADSAAKKLRLA
ncbi:MAG TPA: metal-dependent hydrolase, partial [Acidobacteriota bacterium]|nr:metal-dependent hydrolase [Acidobacteriota bacterium]